MRQFDDIASLRAALAEQRAQRSVASIGFVPTMGNLHAGHLKLVETCRAQCDVCVVSIYVNPLQFGPGEDFASYPRTLEEDRRKLEEAGVDLLFAPADEELYPHGRDRQTRVVVPELTEILCGRSRPSHFDGVATVVLKLLNIVQPDYAYFGEKDYQQLVVLKTMAAHLDLPVRILGVETQRAPSGLALSSRNQYLSEAESNRAPELYRTLREIGERLRQGERDLEGLQRLGRQRLTAAGLEPDYCAIRNPDDLSEPRGDESELLILAAAWLGRARLIDNLRITAGERR